MLHLDLTHSSHSPAQTGIQQVARGLWRELIKTGRAESIVYDKYAHRWRALDKRENHHLHTVDQLDGVRRKRPHWSTWQRVRGHLQHRFGRHWISPTPSLGALLVPEFYDDFVREELPRLRNVMRGPDIAIFHDAIAFLQPEWGVSATTERYPAYLRSLAGFKGIACVSEFSRQQLNEAWKRLGIESEAVLEAIPLGLRTDHLGARVTEATEIPKDRPLRLLCVSTIEPRKNHASLLQACERLWKRGIQFELRLIGLHNRGFPPEIPSRIAEMQKSGQPVRWDGAVSAETLRLAFETADLSIYPSLCEGFGLPVWESLYHGTPCVTTDGGALAEVAPGGGCAIVPHGDTNALEQTMAHLLQSPETLERLTIEACTRPLRTMSAYADDLVAFVKRL